VTFFSRGHPKRVALCVLLDVRFGGAYEKRPRVD
jgi:hypothetical protein